MATGDYVAAMLRELVGIERARGRHRMVYFLEMAMMEAREESGRERRRRQPRPAPPVDAAVGAVAPAGELC